LYKKCDLLTEELTSLERLSDGHIDHPKNFSKDQADAVCGATYLASEFAEEYSYNYGENLEAGLDVSLETSDSAKRTRMIAEFEQELTQIYTDIYAELDAAEAMERQQRQAEYQRYKDIADGIIFLG
jgi:hypothetical protein